MVKIKHKQQVNDGYNWKCGAACLEMIFDYYDINYNKNDIWDNIKVQRPNAALDQYCAPTSKVAKYAIINKLYATIYKAKNHTCLEILKQINDKNIPSVLSIREKASGQSHFVVYTGIENKEYYYVDPNCKLDLCNFKNKEIEDVWSPQPEIGVTGYILIVFDFVRDEKLKCRECGISIPIVHSSLRPLAEGIVCPYCGNAAYKDGL